MQRHKSVVSLRDMFLLLCTLSVIAHMRGSTNMADDEVLLTEDNHCQPILVNGELMPTVPKYMPSFPVSLKGIKRHFVCKLSASTTTTTQDTTMMFTTESTTTHSTTTTHSKTTQDTTAMSTTESTTSHPTTTTPSTTTQATTTMSTTESTTSHPTTTPLLGISIAESSHMLYIAYGWSSYEITTMDIGQGSAFPGNEAKFVTGLTTEPFCVELDEEQGFLYWSMYNRILRKPLNGSGSTETVYSNSGPSRISGLSIDLSRDPRRIFFCDYVNENNFYKDVDSDGAHDLTGYMNDPDINGDTERHKLGGIRYFNDTLYWTKRDSPRAIAVMTNYDQSSRSFDIKEISQFITPFRLVITNVDPLSIFDRKEAGGLVFI